MTEQFICTTIMSRYEHKLTHCKQQHHVREKSGGSDELYRRSHEGLNSIYYFRFRTTQILNVISDNQLYLRTVSMLKHLQSQVSFIEGLPRRASTGCVVTCLE